MKYELTFITRGSEDTATAEAHLKTVLDLAKQNNVKETATHQWGRRALAYPIKREQFGYYTTLELEAEGDEINQLDHALRLNRNFIRLLTTRAFDNPVALSSEHKEAATDSGDEAPRTAEESLRREHGTAEVKTTRAKKTTTKKTAVSDEKERAKQVAAALEDILADDNETKEK